MTFDDTVALVGRRRAYGIYAAGVANDVMFKTFHAEEPNDLLPALGDETLDRRIATTLLAHARQDAASAHILAEMAIQEARKLRVFLWLALALQTATVVLLAT